MQPGALHGVQQQMGAIAARTPLHGRGHRPPAAEMRVLGDLGGGGGQEIQRRGLAVGFGAQQRQMRERREAGRFALLQFGLGKGVVAAVDQRFQQRMPGVVGLQPAPRPDRSARPARPATWISSCASFSLARKSAENRPSSMPTTTTRVSLGRSWPLARICVPTRIPARSPSSASWVSSASRRRWCRGRCASTGRPGRLRPACSSRRSVPMPCGCSARLPQSGQASGAACRAPQWWHCRRRPPACTVIGASQRWHGAVQPQSWQSSTGA